MTRDGGRGAVTRDGGRGAVTQGGRRGAGVSSCPEHHQRGHISQGCHITVYHCIVVSCTARGVLPSSLVIIIIAELGCTRTQTWRKYYYDASMTFYICKTREMFSLLLCISKQKHRKGNNLFSFVGSQSMVIGKNVE